MDPPRVGLGLLSVRLFVVRPCGEDEVIIEGALRAVVLAAERARDILFSFF